MREKHRFNQYFSKQCTSEGKNIYARWQEELDCAIIFVSPPPLTRMYDRVGQMAAHVFRPPLATPAIHLFRLNNGTSRHLCKYLGANLPLVS